MTLNCLWQRGYDLNVCLREVTSSTINAALIPILIDTVQQLNCIIFLEKRTIHITTLWYISGEMNLNEISSLFRKKKPLHFKYMSFVTHLECQFAGIFWLKIVECSAARSRWSLLGQRSFGWWPHWRRQRWCWKNECKSIIKKMTQFHVGYRVFAQCIFNCQSNKNLHALNNQHHFHVLVGD